LRPARLELLGCAFDRVTLDEAAARCVAWATGPRVPHTVITANAAILCAMRGDVALRAACRGGDLVVADGMPVVWTARARRTPLPERVAGVDLMARLLEEAGARRLRVYFLGARPEVVAELARRSTERHPGLVVAGARDGYFARSADAAVVEEIRRAAPHFLFVGMPSPFKETWCEAHRERLDVPVIMGVGGSFDVLAGYVRRAPAAFQRAGMEWSWRLAMEPRKMWKRYLFTNSTFLALAAREVAARHLGRPAPAG
jgi:N-acetylglucosaminyldiphosphoundecaprenol N-acetyl-beta-D-mannosaminyltransferase